MTEREALTPPGGPDGLVRWLVGGLAAGGVMLGLLIAAYAIGYHRGQHDSTTNAPATQAGHATSIPTSTAASPTKPNATNVGPVTPTPALVALGKTLYTNNGCSGCHSLTGAPGAGPSFKGLAGGTSALTNGQTVAVDDAYLERSISSPDAQIVKGYRGGIMSAAIASFDLPSKPDDIRALVAFIKSRK